MRDLDVDGSFWLEHAPDDKVAGRLRFESRSGARLDLIGSFRADADAGHDRDALRIHGVAGGELLTLETCFRVNGSSEYP